MRGVNWWLDFMICNHCKKNIHDSWKALEAVEINNFGLLGINEFYGPALQIKYMYCPSCTLPIIKFVFGMIEFNPIDSDYLCQVNGESIIYPHEKSKIFSSVYVPEEYLKIYNEAAEVLSISPKACAALLRNLLQTILHNEYGIREKNLSQEIITFSRQEGIPSYLLNAIDAVRVVGNFASHPIKDENTGVITEVEAGEAEWLLNIMESLFDYRFVQPAILNENKIKLNIKLKEAGKPELE